MYYLFILLELLSLFFLSRQITKSLSLLLQLFRFHQTDTVIVIAFLFLPGTIVHELAHWVMAKLLFVPTGQISLLPKLQGTTLRMGSVGVAKTDVIRQLLIGVAPFLSGIVILLLSLHFLLPLLQTIHYLSLGLFIYLLFIITNSMFSSKKDLEGTVGFLLIVTVGVLAIFLLKPEVFWHMIHYIQAFVPTNTLRIASYYIAIPLVIDIVVILFLNVAIRVIRK